MPATPKEAPDVPATLAAAVVALQAAMPHIGSSREADTGTYKYRYAGLHDVAEALYPAMAAVGLCFTACPTLLDGRFVLDYRLDHVSGESRGGLYPLADPTRSTGQQIGSAITYARRYALTAVTGIVVDPDDDGSAAPEAPPVDPVTVDPAWVENIVQRIDVAESAGVLRGLHSEAGEQVRSRRVSPEDARRIKACIDARHGELTPAATP